MQIIKPSVLSLGALIPSTLALHHLPFICVSSPPIPLEAGTSTVSAVLEDPLNRRCEATIFFANPDFLPISYSFDSACSGRKVNSFKLPIGAPNGEAYVSWHCAGQAPSCTRAVITGGRGDPSLPLQNEGDVGCISQSVLTRTTLATVTRSSRTFVETVATLITSMTTDFAAEATTAPGGSDTATRGTFTATGTAATQTATTQAAQDGSSTRPSPDDSAATTVETTLATATNVNGAGDDPSADAPPASPESTSPPDPLETFTSTAPGLTTSLTTTAAVTAAVSTLTIMQTVTASCSADA